MLNNQLPTPNMAQIGKHQKFIVDVLLRNAGSQVRVRLIAGRIRMDNIEVVMAESKEGYTKLCDVQSETFDSLIQRNILVPAGKQRLTVSLNRQYYILNPLVKTSSTTKKQNP